MPWFVTLGQLSSPSFLFRCQSDWSFSEDRIEKSPHNSQALAMLIGCVFVSFFSLAPQLTSNQNASPGRWIRESLLGIACSNQGSWLASSPLSTGGGVGWLVCVSMNSGIEIEAFKMKGSKINDANL